LDQKHFRTDAQLTLLQRLNQSDFVAIVWQEQRQSPQRALAAQNFRHFIPSWRAGK
jgi:hypothetical protein